MFANATLKLIDSKDLTDKIASAATEKLVKSFIQYDSVPHCFFPELVQSSFYFSPGFSREKVLDCFYDLSTFKAVVSQDSDFYKGKLTDFAGYCLSEELVKARFWLDEKNYREIAENEFIKLAELIKVAWQHKINEIEDVEVDEGSEIIFSTPDPELPEEFLTELKKISAAQDWISKVYVFDTTRVNESKTSLNIGFVTKREVPENQLNILMMAVFSAVDSYLEDRDLIDFMILEDPELIELAESVSPEIKI